MQRYLVTKMNSSFRRAAQDHQDSIHNTAAHPMAPTTAQPIAADRPPAVPVLTGHITTITATGSRAIKAATFTASQLQPPRAVAVLTIAPSPCHIATVRYEYFLELFFLKLINTNLYCLSCKLDSS